MKLLYQTLFIGLFYFLPSTIFSQESIEISAGYQFRDYLVSNRYTGPTNLDLSLGHGANIEIVAQFYDSEAMFCPIRLGISYSQYSTTMNISQNLKIGSSSTSTEVKISRLELQIHPANFKLKDLEINLGLFFNILLTEEHQGTNYSNYPNQGAETSPVQTNSSYGNYKGIGFISRWSYNIPIAKQFVLIPSYSISLGLSNEFNEIDSSSRYLRQMPMLGIKYMLK